LEEHSAPPKVAVVGITDGGAESLSPPLLRKIRAADILCGGERHLAFFPEVKAEKWVIKDNLPELIERLRVEREKKHIVILASGDPNFYGIGGYLNTRLPKDLLEIFPNLTTVQIAFARLRESWQDVGMVSVHGRPLDSLLNVVLSYPKVAILTDPNHSPSVIARFLLGHEIPDCRAVVCEHLGGSTERITETRLSLLPGQEFSPLNLLIIFQEMKTKFPVRFGLPDSDLAHRDGQITKQEYRAIGLMKMGLTSTSVVWDIGAGSGSVSVEAALLASAGVVYAVEKDPEAIELIKKNLTRFSVTNVKLAHAYAPQGLAELAAPDAVFIGGSGGKSREILLLVHQRLKPRGRVVIHAITLETLTEALSIFKELGWHYEATQVSVGRLEGLGKKTFFHPLNPIYIIVGARDKDDLG